MNRQALSSTSLPWVSKNEPPNPEEIGLALNGLKRDLCLLARKLLPLDLSSKADPEDLVQEAFAEAIRTFERFSGTNPEDLLGWVGGILRHVVANFAKAFRRQKRHSGRERSLEVALAAGVSEPPSREPAPESYLWYCEEIALPLLVSIFLLEEFVGGSITEVFVQHYRCKRSFEDIAKDMGISRSMPTACGKRPLSISSPPYGL